MAPGYGDRLDEAEGTYAGYTPSLQRVPGQTAYEGADVTNNHFPPVIVLIITYRRLNLALETIRSVKQHLVYPNYGFHIADDGSGQEYVERLCREIGGSYSISITDSARAGVGRNMNLGISGCLQRSDLWLHLEDDWVLRRPLDLKPCVDALMLDQSIGMIRLGRLSADIKAVSYSQAGQLWWKLQKGSNSYVYSGNAALKHRRFAQTYGPYQENLTPGRTELSYCHKFDNTRGPEILWPAFLSTEDMFFHIGDHQSFKWYMETGGLTAEQAAEKFSNV